MSLELLRNLRTGSNKAGMLEFLFGNLHLQQMLQKGYHLISGKCKEFKVTMSLMHGVYDHCGFQFTQIFFSYLVHS
jgi:hypothetical protein